jgi:LPS sulfotransferase NodH
VLTLAAELAPGKYDWLAGAAAAQTDDGIYREIAALLAPILPNPRYVRLKREDTVAQAVSNSVAIQRRRWRRIDASDPAHEREVEFRFDGIASALARIQNYDAHWARYCASNGAEPHVLTYEALAADLPGEVTRLRAALGLPAVEVPVPRLQKQSDGASKALVQSFREQFRALTRGG